MAKIINIKKNTDSRGSLSAIEDIDIGFDIKRIFNIYDLDENSIRGCHGHKETIMALSCLQGSCKIYCNDGKKKEIFSLNEPNQYLILQPQDWHKIYDFRDKPILQILASKHWDKDDYVHEEPK